MTLMVNPVMQYQRSVFQNANVLPSRRVALSAVRTAPTPPRRTDKHRRHDAEDECTKPVMNPLARRSREETQTGLFASRSEEIQKRGDKGEASADLQRSHKGFGIIHGRRENGSYKSHLRLTRDRSGGAQVCTMDTSATVARRKPSRYAAAVG